MRVLLLEPDEVLSSSYKKILLNGFHTVSCVSSGQQAMDLLDQQSCDLIIIEPELKDHDGLEFLHELRSYKDLSSVGIILHSSNYAYARLAESPAKEVFGIKSFLYKPTTSLKMLADIVNA